MEDEERHEDFAGPVRGEETLQCTGCARRWTTRVRTAGPGFTEADVAVCDVCGEPGEVV